jgi:nucleoside-diphosphate-sugar epimerase
VRVLVTGASGFVGRSLIHAFRASGGPAREIHTLSRTPIAPGRSGGRRWLCDLLDERSVRAAIAAVRPEVLVHAAWHTPAGRYLEDEANAAWLAASERLLQEFADAGGRRFVSVGSCAEYREQAEPCHETRTPLAPRSAYGAAKAAFFERLEKVRATSRVETAHARLFFLYGPGEKPSRLVPSLVAALRAGRPAETGPPDRVRDFLHVRDAGCALARLVRSDLTGPINIASGSGTRIEDVALTLADIAGRRDLLRLGALAARAAEPHFVVADVTRQTDELGYSAETTLACGLEEAFTASSAEEVPC